jgi:hypothetical protein
MFWDGRGVRRWKRDGRGWRTHGRRESVSLWFRYLAAPVFFFIAGVTVPCFSSLTAERFALVECQRLELVSRKG